MQNAGASGNALRCLIGSEWRDEVSKVDQAFVGHFGIEILLLSEGKMARSPRNLLRF